MNALMCLSSKVGNMIAIIESWRKKTATASEAATVATKRVAFLTTPCTTSRFSAANATNRPKRKLIGSSTGARKIPNTERSSVDSGSCMNPPLKLRMAGRPTIRSTDARLPIEVITNIRNRRRGRAFNNGQKPIFLERMKKIVDARLRPADAVNEMYNESSLVNNAKLRAMPASL